MKELLDNKNINFAVGIYPDEFQVNETLLSEVLRHFSLEKKDYEINLMQRILIEYLNKIKIPHLNLLDSFKKKAVEQRVYLCQDSHWNQAGNELAAELIFQYLVPHIDSSIKTNRK